MRSARLGRAAQLRALRLLPGTQECCRSRGSSHSPEPRGDPTARIPGGGGAELRLVEDEVWITERPHYEVLPLPKALWNRLPLQRLKAGRIARNV